jgi:hypothetical protein
MFELPFHENMRKGRHEVRGTHPCVYKPHHISAGKFPGIAQKVKNCGQRHWISAGIISITFFNDNETLLL